MQYRTVSEDDVKGLAAAMAMALNTKSNIWFTKFHAWVIELQPPVSIYWLQK